MSDPILITGAAGFAGSHLLDLLETADVPVVAWRLPGERMPAPPTGTRSRWMEVDILDAETVVSAILTVRPAAVYHLAGIAHAGGSWDRAVRTLEVNVLGTHHVLTALGQLERPPRVLISGSSLVYRTLDGAIAETAPVGPSSPYGLSKLAQEMTGVHAVADLGLPVLLTRSFNHIGPRQDPSFFASSVARQVARIEQHRSDPVLEVGNLDARRDLTDVRDTVRAYQAILERGRVGAPYNVCSGQAFRIGDILEILLSRSTAAIHVRIDPARYRPHDAPLFLGDRGLLARELGWAPRVPIEQTLTDLLDYWRGVVAAEAG